MRRDHHGGFEFTRQIRFTEDRLFVGGGDFFFIPPDLRIGTGAWQQMLREFLCPLIRFLMQLRLNRVRRTEHVTVNVVGGRQRIQPHLMQHLMRRLNVLLQNAVKLEGLTVSQTDAAIDSFIGGKFVDGQPLSRRNDAAR